MNLIKCKTKKKTESKMNKTGEQLEIKPENTTVSMILIHNIKQ